MSVIGRIWHYLRFAVWLKAEEAMDPAVQLEMAMHEALNKDDMLREQASKVIGYRNQLSIQLVRDTKEIAVLKEKTMQALKSVDKAKAEDEKEKFENAAETLAIDLQSKESSIERLKEQLVVAEEQAEFAKEQVATNALQVKEMATRKMEIMGKLEQAKLQKQVVESLEIMTKAVGGNTPTFREIEAKIDKDMAVSSARQELHGESAHGTMKMIDAEVVKERSQNRLKELRAEMRGEKKEEPLLLEEATSTDNLVEQVKKIEEKVEA